MADPFLVGVPPRHETIVTNEFAVTARRPPQSPRDVLPRSEGHRHSASASWRRPAVVAAYLERLHANPSGARFGNNAGLWTERPRISSYCRFMTEVDGYRVEPLTPVTWNVFAALVERNNGLFGGVLVHLVPLPPGPTRAQRDRQSGLQAAAG